LVSLIAEATRLITILLFEFKGSGVSADLLNHSDEAVASSRREVFAQADFVNEVKVGVEDFVGGMVRENAYEQ
jgi:hypothetical protein